MELQLSEETNPSAMMLLGDEAWNFNCPNELIHHRFCSLEDEAWNFN